MPNISQPQNLIVGQPTELTPPINGTVGSEWDVVVYNPTSYQVLVQVNGRQYILEPLSADFFPGRDSVEVNVQPINTSAASGTYCGMVQANWAQRPDNLEGSFPQPLTPFSGGSDQIAQLPGGSATNELSFIVSIPAGVGYLQFNPTGQGGGFAGFVFVQGEQTGTIYSAGIPGTAFDPVNGLTIDMIPCGDTSLAVDLIVHPPRGGGETWGPINLYAIASPPIPTFPTLSTGQASSSPVLAAPTVGAWYLFGADESSTAAGSAVTLTANAEVIAVLTSEGTAGAALFKDHILLNGYRVTTAVTAAGLGVATNVTLRYAPGP